MKEAVIVSGARTAIGGFGGALKDIPAIHLAALVIRETLQRANLRPVVSPAMKEAAPDALKEQGLIELEKKAGAWKSDAQPIAVDEVIMRNVLQASQGQNPARQAVVRAGLCKETPAVSVNKVCGSLLL